MGSLKQETEVVVVGGGPGGYVAAIRAADLGKEVILVEARDKRGGVCLLEGCIPSKALINAIEIAEAAKDAKKMGITIDGVKIDPAALRKFTEGVIDGLSKGIDTLLKKRGVEIVRGHARLDSNHSLALENSDIAGIDFKHCILATGSRVAQLPPAKNLPLWTSTEALELREIPKRLLVVGGGYIGLELGFVYAGLGSKVTVVEVLPDLLAGADADLVAPVVRNARRKFEAVWLQSKVVGVEKSGKGYVVGVEQDGKMQQHEFDQVLSSIGRRPNTDDLGLNKTKIVVDQRGFIQVNEQQRTAEERIFAIGDITPGPGLAHKASREGKIAAEVIAGKPAAFDNVSIPAVVFTDPEVAWTGLTEREAQAKGLNITVGRFPLTALGRAKTMGKTDGLAKVIADHDSGLVLGVGLVGPHASELIAEGVLALEMGATIEDLTATIHPHPTLSESIMEAAEVAEGMPVHILPQ